MTTIHTAHGPGELVETETVHGRTSYRVRGTGFDVWVDAKNARTASEDDGPENLFTYQFPTAKPDPDAYMRGAATYAIGSRGFAHDPALHVNTRNTTTLPYNPTPQVDALTTPGPNQSWGPGEYGQIDPDERLRPSDSLSLRSRGEDKGPGPKPNLFATGAHSAMRERPQIVLGTDEPEPHWLQNPHYDDYGPEENEYERQWADEEPSDFELGRGTFPQYHDQHQTRQGGIEELTRSRHKPFHEDKPSHEPRERTREAPEGPQLRPSDNPVYPFDRVSPSGETGTEMFQGDEPEWYSCPDCGAWHNPYRHMKNRRSPKPPRSDDIFQPAWRGSMVCASCHEAGGRHRDPFEHDDYFSETLPHGAAPELVRDPGNEENVFMKRVPGPGKKKTEHRYKGGPSLMDRLRPVANVFDIEPPTDMPAHFADVRPLASDFTDPIATAMDVMQRQAAIDDASYGLDPRVGMEMDLVQSDPVIREAAWRDVQRKAKRLRTEGRVHIKQNTPEIISATVQGDHGFYDCMIIRGNVFDLGNQSVTAWRCGCPWGRWAFKRRLTYVGRFCSHAYAAYQEMRSAFDRPGKGTRFRTSGVVEEFKKWAEDNGQPTDIDGVANFVTRSRDDDDDPYTEDEVAQLYDYAEDHLRTTPERQFDVPYTFDPDQVYKEGREMLRMTPHSLTPDIQFVPEGEPEHLVDVTKDERTTTGPGQIMTDKTAASEHDDWVKNKQRERNDEKHAEPDIEHFTVHPGSILPPGWHLADADTQSVTDPVRNAPRPDAGEATSDLNKLRKKNQEPLSDNFGHMDEHNDEIRDLIDDLHDAGTDASYFSASLHEADGGFMDKGDGGWLDGGFAGSGRDPKDWYSSSADYIDEHERPNFQDVTNLPDGDILKYNDSDSDVNAPKEPSTPPGGAHEAGVLPPFLADLFSSETSSTSPMGPNIGPQGPMDVAGGAPLMNAGDDMSESGLPSTASFHYADEGDFSSNAGGDFDFSGGDTSSDPGDFTGGGGGGAATMPFTPGAPTRDPLGGGGTGGAGNTTHMLDQPSGGGSQGGGFAPPIAPVLPASAGVSGAGFGGNTGFAPLSGGAPGDMVNPTSPGTSYASHRPSIRDGIRERNARYERRVAFDPSTMPPGWGTTPPDPDDDESPIPKIPGVDEVQQMLPKIPGMPGMPGGKGGGGGGEGGEAAEGGEMAEAAPELLALASLHDNSDVVRQFQATTAGGQYGRGRGAPQGGSRRQAMMGVYGAGPAVSGGGRRGTFSDSDIAGAAAGFLKQAGRNYSAQEQADLMNEYHPQGARNLDGLNLQGTHYVQ